MSLFDSDDGRVGDHEFVRTHTGFCSVCGAPESRHDRVPDTTVVPNPVPHFDGATYAPEFDYARLGKQMRAVAEVVLSGEWYTLAEIATKTGYPEASISARLRDLRKEKFGSHEVERRARGDRAAGLFEYRMTRAVQ